MKVCTALLPLLSDMLRRTPCIVLSCTVKTHANVVRPRFQKLCPLADNLAMFMVAFRCVSCHFRGACSRKMFTR